MTGVELAAIARAVVPPVGAGALCLVTDQQQHRAAFVINGRGKVAVGPSFAKPREAARFMDLLAGDVPAPRPGQTTVRQDPPPGSDVVSSDAASAGTPSSSSAGPTGVPDEAAEEAVDGRAAAEPDTRASGPRDTVTTPAPREAVDRAQTTASLGARVQPQVPRQRPAGRAIDLTPQG